jgi:hypothetical protein
MKKLALVTIMAMTVSSSQALIITPAHEAGQHKPMPGKTQIVTKRESGHHVKIPPKVKLLRSNPYRLTAIRFQDVDPVDAPDDEYLCSTVGRRPKVVHEDVDSEPISSYAETRLLLARHFAMKRYQETWS